MDIKIYHNPRCSKSRKTLALLEENGHQPQIIEYLKSPPSHAELEAILTGLALQPRQLMRRGEAEYKEHGLDNEDLDRTQLITAMVEHPKLIERPIVKVGDRFTLGRPPENVLDILPA